VVRHGADASLALASLLGVPAEDVQVRERPDAVQKLGVADLDRTRLDILGDPVKIPRQVTEQIP